ncbi:MAG: cytochrome c biogenesis protein [Peptococcaceae bacterium]|nr:cytochrome c biogenesis protein [Peptococcaceae bacterium]
MSGILSKRDKLFGIVIGVWLLGTAAAVFALPPLEWFGYKGRILFFHIPMAWIAVLTFLMGAWWSFAYLRSKRLEQFHLSSLSNKVGLVFSLLATGSGAIYAKLTWGAFWNWDVRQTTIFILLLIYTAYIVLGYSIEDEEKRGLISSVYSLFAFVTVPFLIFIIPRIPSLKSTLHPQRFSMDAKMGLVLTAALLGITAFYIWILRYGAARQRVKTAEQAQLIQKDIESIGLGAEGLESAGLDAEANQNGEETV